MPLLRSHDYANSWIKNCPGNLAYYQLSLDPIEFSGMSADEANQGEIEINYTVTAEVNFNKSDQIWYRDSQLFESYQGNVHFLWRQKRSLVTKSVSISGL